MLKTVEGSIIEIRGTLAIIDSDVAAFYGVETKRVNEAVRNNPDKFPAGYLIELNKSEKTELVENFDRFKNLKHSVAPVKAFTEQGLYMLATILKSPQATQTTLAIIEAFTKMRQLGRNIKELANTTSDADKKQLMQQAGEIITDIFADDLEPLESETTYELNFAVLKFKHTVKKGSK